MASADPAAGSPASRRLRELLTHPTVGQVIRFGFVGVANTLVYYVLYRVLLATGLAYLGAHLIAWSLSMVFSFYANCLFTYRVRPTWKRFIAFPVTTLVNVAFTTLGSALLVSLFSADKRYITLIMGILAIPFTFVVTRLVLVGSSGRRQRDWRGLVRWLTAPALAAAGAVAIHVLIAFSLELTPFGNANRAVGDYGPQYLPFHIYLWNVLNGHAIGDIAFSWTPGAGTGMLPLYATYLSGPFTLLIGIFPLRWMDAAIMAVSLARIGLAAAAMVMLLQYLRPRAPRVAAIALGLGYACSSWVLQLGMITPMWLDGLLGFPLICLAGMLTVKKRAVIGPVVLIALPWWSNYYSALMASVGAALFMVAWLIATRGPLFRGLFQFGLRGVLAVASGLWLIWPTYKAIAVVYNPPGALLMPQASEVTLSLFGFTAGIRQAPMLFAGSLVLVSAACVLLAPRLDWRARISWTVLGFGLVAVLRFEPLIMLFNGGDLPNGNAFRWSFVVTGILALVGWQSFTQDDIAGRPDPRGWLTRPQLVLAAVVVVGLMVHALTLVPTTVHVTYSAWWLGPLVALVWLQVGTVLRGRWIGLWQFGLILGVVLELTWSGVIVIPHSRYGYAESPRYVAVSAAQQAQGAAVVAASGWPSYRTGGALNANRPDWIVPNDPLYFNQPGVGMYASVLPETLGTTLTRLGTAAATRRTSDHTGVLTETVLAISARADAVTGQIITRPVFPMVRTLGSPAIPAPYSVDSAGLAAFWQQYFDTPVVSAAQVTRTWADGVPASPTDAVVLQRERLQMDYTITCTTGTPSFRAPKIAHGGFTVLDGEHKVTGTTDGGWVDDLTDTGKPVTVRVSPTATRQVALGAAVCIDHQALSAAVAATEVPSITVTPHGIRAEFGGPQTGQVLIATTYQPGWSCRADGRSVTPVNRAGLLAVPVTGQRSMSCSHRQPGLAVGIVGSAAALLATSVWAMAPALTGSRSQRPRKKSRSS